VWFNSQKQEQDDISAQVEEVDRRRGTRRCALQHRKAPLIRNFTTVAPTGFEPALPP